MDWKWLTLGVIITLLMFEEGQSLTEGHTGYVYMCTVVYTDKRILTIMSNRPFSQSITFVTLRANAHCSFIL